MLSRHKWEIGVCAGSYYPDLTQKFWGNDISLCFEDDHMGLQFYAFSHHIDELDDPEQVARRLYSLQLILNGALRLAWNENFTPPVQFTHFYLCRGGAHHDVHASNIEFEPFSQNSDIDRYESKYCPATGRFSSFIVNRCKQDEAMRTLVFQIGLISLNSSLEKIMSWATLYKIYDSVKFYSEKNGYDFSDFCDQKKIKEFTAACNNSMVLGIYARHGEKGWKEPAAAITDINEATELIIDLAHNFVTMHIKATQQ